MKKIKHPTPETEGFKQLAYDYIKMTFGIDFCKDIQNIPEGVSGSYEIKNDVDIEGGYYFQRLLFLGNEIENNDPKGLDRHKEVLEIARNINGSIFVSGLGLGSSLHEFLKIPGMAKIVIIEMSGDIIKLVAPSFQHDKRVQIIQGDVFKYEPEEQFELVYHALWSKKEDVSKEMVEALTEAFRPYCDKQVVLYNEKGSI